MEYVVWAFSLRFSGTHSEGEQEQGRAFNKVWWVDLLTKEQCFALIREGKCLGTPTLLLFVVGGKKRKTMTSGG